MNIDPKNQTVENCLGRRYYIDFYQREYVWDKKTVETLLNDIFYQFELSYQKFKDSDISKGVIGKYNWYYLNIYIINDVGGKEYIVDGQQRLTTLTLIIIKLLKLIENEDLKSSLKKCVKGQDKYKGSIFWIDNDKRKDVMDYIMGENNENKDFDGITQKNIKEQYKNISNYLDLKFKAKDDKKIKSFSYYFLDRLVLVELKVTKDDTPMIFEVINDRGLALRPFEILKGKLLGSLDKEDIENYNSCWEESMTKLRDIQDNFFIDYFKAKFIFNRNSDLEKRINNDYHRYIFEENEIAKKLGFRKQDENYKQNIKGFVEKDKDLSYYGGLYSRIKESENHYLIYNNYINQLSGQYQNIMAACHINDEKEKEKIETIAKEIDRLYILLHLNNAYDSNNFQSISYGLNESLRNPKSIDEYREIFNKKIEDRIKEKHNLTNVKLLDYDRFKMQGYDSLNKRVLRYLLARIEYYICEKSKQNMQESISNLATKTNQADSNYQIEHILANNDENKEYFLTEEEFLQKRNLLGGLLLLKGKNNSSSNNEYYGNKLKTYSNGLMLGRTLTKDCYKSNLDFTNWNNPLSESFKPIEKFDEDALKHRTKVLYNLVKLIWEID